MQLKFRGTKGSIGHTFMVCIHTENQNQGDFYPFVLLEISVLHESPLGHLRYGLTDVRQVSFTLLMTDVATVIQVSTRGTLDSDNWFLRLSDQALPRSYHLPDYG